MTGSRSGHWDIQPASCRDTWMECTCPQAEAVAYRYGMPLEPSDDCSGSGVTTEHSSLHPWSSPVYRHGQCISNEQPCSMQVHTAQVDIAKLPSATDWWSCMSTSSPCKQRTPYPTSLHGHDQ
jgi:hypothetical protein